LGDGRLIAQVNNDVRYFLADQQGSTRLLSDAAGAITSSYDYSAFGETLSTNAETAYLYTGQQYDAATAMYSLRARYYAPGAGRFVSRDVWPVDYGDPFELNRYGYMGGNPIRWTDPTGWHAGTLPAPGPNAGSQSGGGNDYSALLQMTLWQIRVTKVFGVVVGCITARHVSRLLAHSKQGMALFLLELLQPSPNPCHIPVQITPSLLLPDIAAHIQTAQAGVYPMLLYYHADENKATTVRNHVCRRGPSNPRPLGMQCDEYPYASTDIYPAQPATPRVVSTTFVPIDENRTQGVLLGGIFGVGGFYGISMLRRPGEFAAVVI
jgi:RHS repeat-associated protein